MMPFKTFHLRSLKSHAWRWALLCMAAFGLNSVALAQDCKVLPFTASIFIGDKPTIIDATGDPDCLSRARKLAFHGKWDAQMSAAANAAYNSEWLTDGEKKAVEMADYMGKNSTVKAGVDVLTGAATAFAKVRGGEAGAKEVAKISLGLLSKAVEFIRVRMVLSDVSQARVDAADLVSKSLKLMASSVDCSIKKNYKCVEILRTSLKASGAFNKVFGLNPLFGAHEQFITGFVELIVDAASITENIASPSYSDKFLAAAGMLDATAKTMTGEYWRDKTAIPDAWDQSALIIASAGSIWLSCGGAAESLVVEENKYKTVGIAADCVSRINDYLNTNLSRILSYTYVLNKAAEAVFQARKITVARLVMVERLKFGATDALYTSHKIDPTAVDRAARLCEKLAMESGYNYRTDLYRAMQLWSPQRFGSEVVGVVNQYVDQGIRSDAQALYAGTVSPTEYAKGSTVRFLVSRIEVAMPNSGNWDATAGLVVTAKSFGQNKGATVQAQTAAGRVLASASLVPSVNNKDGTSDWYLDLSAQSGFKALADGSYVLKALLVGTNGTVATSSAQALVVKRTVASGTLTLGSILATVAQGGTLTLRVNVAGRPNAQPSLVIKNANAGTALSGPFATKVATTATYEQWQFQQALTSLPPGSYSYHAEVAAGTPVQSDVGTLTVTAVNAVSGTVDNPARLSAKVGETVQLFGKVSNADVVYLDFYTTTAATPRRERAEVVNKAAGTWAHPRAFPVAGNLTYQVRAEDPVTKALTDLGGRFVIDITDVATPPPPLPTPDPVPVPVSNISAAQPLSPLRLNQIASFELTGSNLSTATPPRVSLAGCDGPALAVASATSARFTCTPRVPGAARLFWKLPGTDNRENELGQFNVLPASADGMDYLSNTPDDNLLYEGGAKFTKTWQLKNIGTTPWTSAWCLRPQAGPALGTAAVCVTGTVPPGSAYNFSVPMTMPAAQAATVTLRQYWRLENAARAQVGTQVYAVVRVNAKLQVLEPFAMPDSVRVNTEWWVGSLKLSGAASQVRMQLTGPQGALTPFVWTPATADQWSLQYRFSTPGDYSWTLSVQGATGTDSRSGTVKVLPAVVVNAPVVTPTASTRVELGKPWTLDVGTSVTAAAMTVQFAGEPAVRLVTTDNRRFTHTRSFATVGARAYTLRAMFPNAAAQALQGSVQVDAMATLPPVTPPPPPPPPPPPVALNPQLTRAASVQALLPWSATLRTDAPVYQADLVFKTGRRIPFDGGPQQWATRDENSRFSDAGNFDYELQLRRSAASPLEVFPGGTLEVRAAVVPANPPRITSAASVAQGQPYNLTVQTAAPADKVMVRWPDQANEQGLRPLDAARTQWEFGSRLFPTAGALPFTLRSYKDGFSQPTGELQASLQVTVPNAAMKLLEISRNIIKGEQPYFTVEASLAVTQVTVKLGSLAAVPLVGSGPNGAVQNFRARVRVAEVGMVPYLITGFNAQGQAVGAAITGTVPVADVGDALTVPNPVPAELQRGQAVAWMFRTAQSANEMWAEFSAPIGNLPLTGYYLNHTFNVPAGNYSYRVMRRDHLGNVFAIQGAAGSLRIKDAVQVAVPTAQVQVAPNPAQVGQAVQFNVRLSSGQDVARLEWVFPSTGPLQAVQAVAMQQTGPATWALAQAFASAGSRSSQLKVTMSDGRSAVLGTAVVTTAAAAQAYTLRVAPASVRVGQSMGFAVQVADPASVARADLVFTDVNVTEALVQSAANTWARTRTMAQAGTNRPYVVRLLLKTGATAQVSGTYTVLP